MISNGACGHETTSVVWGNTDRNHMVDPISNTAIGFVQIFLAL